MRVYLTLVAIVVLLATSSSARPMDVELLLTRVRAYVAAYQQALSQVLSEEVYEQRVYLLNIPGDSLRTDLQFRITRSEMAFLWIPADGTWFTVRDVKRYKDGDRLSWRPVADGKGRLERLLRESTTDLATLKRVADDSARFNVGGVVRNWNSPTLALQFLAPAYRLQFTFTTAGKTPTRADEPIEIAFTETGHPTVIAYNGDDLPASGSIWARASDGAIVRTQLIVHARATTDDPEMQGSVDVDYRRDDKLDMWVPARMEEQHTLHLDRQQQHIVGHARYSSYRRFETGARLLPPD